MRLTKKRLLDLKAVADQNSLWINTSWTSWPNQHLPQWCANGQFTIANELVRLALIGLEHDDKST